jgi:hypothetical protein
MEYEKARACNRQGEKRTADMILVGKPEGKRPLEDLRMGGTLTFKWLHVGHDRNQWRVL